MLTQSKPSLTVRAAAWSAAHPWRAIVGWVLFVAVCFAAGKFAGGNLAAGKDFWIGAAGKAESIAESGALPRKPTEKVLITAPEGPLDQVKAKAVAVELTERMSALPAVESVAAPARSADGAAVLVAITMKGDIKSARAHVDSITKETVALQGLHPELKLAQTGDSSTSQGTERLLGNDVRTAEMITLPVTLLILFLVFGALLAAAVPLLLAASSVAAALGLYALASHLLPDAGGVVTNVVLMMGLAVGVDYSLFYLKRVREERQQSGGQLSHAAAVTLAAATSGRAIVVSGFAVLVSLVGLYLAEDVIFTSIATGSIIVVLVTMVSSLTVLPALLVKLGRRIDGRRKPLWRSRNSEGRVWAAMLRPATRHPVITLVAATGAMVLLALPALNLTLRVEGKDTFPKSIPAIATYDTMIGHFPAEGVSHWISARTDSANADKLAAAMTELASNAQRDPLFAKTAAPNIRTSADGLVRTLELPVPHRTNSAEAVESLDRLRTQLLPQTLGRVSGAEFAVSGEVARSVDYAQHQAGHTPWVIAFVLLLTFLMMVVAFKSVVIGLISVLLNLLSAAAAFGALVGVFQYTWAEDLLGFTSGGYIGARIPLLLFVILFGLSMDYQIFVVSRIREAALRGVPTRRAVFEGLTSSAGVVTSAAVVMVSVFVSFMFVSMVEMKQTGFGLAVAVLLDAVVIRIMILPALMTLLGDRSWWPSRAVLRARAVAAQESLALTLPVAR